MKLQIIFPENLIIAALDLIDRGSGKLPLYIFHGWEVFNCTFFSVIRRITPWGHTEYQVLGSTATYTILLDLDAAPRVPYSCTCPSFIYSVLLSETHIMVCFQNNLQYFFCFFKYAHFLISQCKHLLAAFLARNLSLSIERPTDLDDLTTLYNMQFALAETTATTELQ